MLKSIFVPSFERYNVNRINSKKSRVRDKTPFAFMEAFTLYTRYISRVVTKIVLVFFMGITIAASSRCEGGYKVIDFEPFARIVE